MHGPTLPAGEPASTIGAAAFHGLVRDGSAWVRRAQHTPMATGSAQVALILPVQLHTASWFVCVLSVWSWPTGPPIRHRREALDRAHASPAHVAMRPARAALPSHLLGVLPAYSCESIYLAAPFPLRCLQRFRFPDVATEPAGRPTTPPPAVCPARSSRTRASPAQCSNRAWRIETELSHDVLNPARVPL